jgi:hypothetical protein
MPFIGMQPIARRKSSGSCASIAIRLNRSCAFSNADSPLAEYRKITDEILKRIPDEDRYPGRRPKSFAHSYCYALVCISGSDKRIFANCASAHAGIFQRQNAGWRT